MGFKLRLWDFNVDYEFLLVIMGFYWQLCVFIGCYVF